MQHFRHGVLSLTLSALGFGCAEDSCFLGETEVATPTGMRRIADLAVGDEVYSFDHEHAELVVRMVRRIFVSQVTTVCRVETNGASVRGVTPSHPFFDAHANAYVALRDLAPTARLLRLNAMGAAPFRSTQIERVAIDERAEPCFTVYNLEVEGPEHNYFADGVLVHNKSEAVEERLDMCNASVQAGESLAEKFLIASGDFGDDTVVEVDIRAADFGPWIEGPTVTNLEHAELVALDADAQHASVYLRIAEDQLEAGYATMTFQGTADGYKADERACSVFITWRIYFQEGAIDTTDVLL